MKEIDFIPEWYRTGRKRRVGYRRQYTMIGCLFVALLAWSYAAGSFLSATKAAVEGARKLLDASEPFAREYMALKNEITELSEKADVLERICARTPPENILAELSCLVSDKVVLSSLEISSEPLGGDTSDKKSGAVVIGRGPGGNFGTPPEADVCTKVILAGIAADASEVAALIAAMEKSVYFCRIIPGYSRNKDVRGCLATEFQISAYVADYLVNNEVASK